MLVELVGSGTESTGSAVGDGVLAGNVTLGLLLVGLLRSFSTLSLEGLADVVGSVADRVGDLADDSLIWLINVWGRHDEVVVKFFAKVRDV